MYIARVVGNIWATRKEEALTGYKLLIVEIINLEGQAQGPPMVAVDRIGAGTGELVLVVRGSSARRAAGRDDTPVDATVVGIIDTVEVARSQILRTDGEQA